MHATVRSAALIGVDAIEVRVEASLAGGLPAVHVVGLPDAAVREAKERVRAALRSCGATLPPSRVVVNLAPADVRKEGPAFDLPIALALLAAQSKVPTARLQEALAVGELGLDGSVRPVRGIVALALRAVASGCGTLLLPEAQAWQARLVPGLELVPLRTLLDAVAWCRGREDGVERSTNEGAPAPPNRSPPPPVAGAGAALELADVRGHAIAKRALEVAAAGGHNLLLIGPPGGGKSMLARRLVGLLPPLDDAAALEVARLHSVAGTDRDPGDRRPPLREPHHTSSTAGLLGSERGPGELSLAHRGLLFLDELPEFDRRALEALRQPLESGVVVLNRARGRAVLPSAVQLVAAMNPCPCGFDGDEQRPCRCHPSDRKRYQGRISGPLLDRFELRLILPRLDPEQASLDAEASGAGSVGPIRATVAESSAVVAARVAAARARALARQGAANAALPAGAAVGIPLHAGARALLVAARGRGQLGERGSDQILRVARTIADLAGEVVVGDEHLAEALAYRAEPWRAPEV